MPRPLRLAGSPDDHPPPAPPRELIRTLVMAATLHGAPRGTPLAVLSLPD